MTIHGVNLVEPFAPGGLPDFPAHYRLWDCGVTWRHLHVAPNVINFERLDAIVNRVTARDPRANLSYVFAATPRWLATDPDLPHAAPWLGAGSNSKPWSLDHWAWFADEVVRRYRGRIGSYQIWNEPQLKDFWGYDEYATLGRMTHVAREVIRAADPEARVVAAPVLLRPSSGGVARAAKYLGALKNAQWPVDVLTAHIYPEPGKGSPRWGAFAKDWDGLLRRLGAPRKPRWVTETNFNLLAPGGANLPPARQRALVKDVDALADQYGIHKVYWYAWAHADPSIFGIPFGPGSPGATALRRLSTGAK